MDPRRLPHVQPLSLLDAGDGGVNYIRNAVKVTIDAYHGTTTFHLLDPKDPIAQTYAKIFPGLLQPLETMPEDLRTRLRYPHGIFALQASMFATFHMQSPAVFYNREDQWEIPAFDVGGQPVRMEPYYTIMKLPGERGRSTSRCCPSRRGRRTTSPRGWSRAATARTTAS